VKWSARAIVIDLRTKYRKRKFVSALKLASAYSPWCDTLGSKGVVKGHGRTCQDGRARPPSGFSGPYCKEPETPNPQHEDCAPGCNCPPVIAKTLVRGLNVNIHEDLQLFDKDGKPLPALQIVIRNLAIQEQDIYVKPSAISAGIALLSQ
jgi:hypothetical protein